jgi:hypothetical protein
MKDGTRRKPIEKNLANRKNLAKTGINHGGKDGKDGKKTAKENRKEW